jgi:hypothetical protein
MCVYIYIYIYIYIYLYICIHLCKYLCVQNKYYLKRRGGDIYVPVCVFVHIYIYIYIYIYMHIQILYVGMFVRAGRATFPSEPCDLKPEVYIVITTKMWGGWMGDADLRALVLQTL